MSASTFLASDTNAANPSVSTCNFCGIAATAVEASSFALVVKAKCEACFSDRKDEWGFKCLATIDATKPQEANDGMVLYRSATTPPKLFVAPVNNVAAFLAREDAPTYNQMRQRILGRDNHKIVCLTWVELRYSDPRNTIIKSLTGTCVPWSNDIIINIIIVIIIANSTYMKNLSLASKLSSASMQSRTITRAFFAQT